MRKRFIILPVIVAIIIFTIIFLYIDSVTEYDIPMPAIFIPDCEFMENVSELDPCSSSSKIFELQLVLDNCETQRKFATGDIPGINADGSINYMFDEEYHFQNRTHYIDNNNCEWRESYIGTVPFNANSNSDVWCIDREQNKVRKCSYP